MKASLICLIFLFSALASLSAEELSKRILRGEYVSIEQYPYMVSLFIVVKGLFNRKSEGRCGGTLIGPDLVLTAAHCFDGKSEPKESHITYGCADLTSPSCRRILIKEVKIHPEYSTGWIDNIINKVQLKDHEFDIAVVRLAEPISGVTPANLPKNGEDIPDEKGILLGWGKTKLWKLGDILKGSWSRVVKFWLNRSTNIFCTKFEGGSGCNGDSGGPFLINNVVYGVYSTGPFLCNRWGTHCFTKVSAMLKFIEDASDSLK